MLDSFCFAEFVSCYTLIHKPNEIDQPEALPDTLIEGNHNCCNCPKIIKLMNSNEKIRCRKVRRVLRYYTPSKHQYPEKYVHHLLLLFYSFRSENYLVEPHTHTKENFLKMV